MKEQVLTGNLREILKELMQKEVEMLPELLDQLEPRDRLNITIKLMPFVFPKVDSISHSTGEPFTLEF